MKLSKKLFYLFLPVVLGSLVGFIISGSIDYKELIKPPLAPPSWLFPVMWTIIYLLMGISYYLLKQDNDNVQGIFTQTVANYPYPVPMKLVAVPTEGDSYTILNFAHPGGLVTIPYSVPKNTTLVLYVVDKENSKMQVK